MNKRNPILIALAILWLFIFILIAFQAYIMSRIWWLVPIALIIGAIIFYLHIFLDKKLQKEKRWAKIILYIYIIINFIPLILQFTGIKDPGLDNIIAGIIGLLLYLSIEKVHTIKKAKKLKIFTKNKFIP